MKSPRIAFTVYGSAFQAPGGGETQLLKTKEFLEKEGMSIHLFDPWKDKLKDFNILHTFGSVKDSLGLMETAQALGVKNVLSTVCWYSWKSAWGTFGSRKDRALAVLRHAGKVFFPCMPSMRKRMMQISDLLCPNSQSEADQLVSFFGVSRERILVVPNGVDPHFAEANADAFIDKYNLRDFVLCVGRIEPRKNQLNFIRALTGTNIPVVIIGDAVNKYQSYYELCRKEAGSNVHFLGAIPHSSPLIPSAYAACSVFVLPTWLETPGLAALEAGLAGAKVVITQEGATREYFQDFASYVDPGNTEDIRSKTTVAVNQARDSRLKEHILNNFLWTHTAKKTLEGYRRLLQGGSS